MSPLLFEVAELGASPSNRTYFSSLLCSFSIMPRKCQHGEKPAPLIFSPLVVMATSPPPYKSGLCHFSTTEPEYCNEVESETLGWKRGWKGD